MIDDLQTRKERLRQLGMQKLKSGGYKKELEELVLVPGAEMPASDSELCIYRKMADKGIEQSSTYHDSKKLQETCPECSGYSPECPSYTPLKLND